jgi:N-acetylmuramoyl-L-alanine amidase
MPTVRSARVSGELVRAQAAAVAVAGPASRETATGAARVPLVSRPLPVAFPAPPATPATNAGGGFSLARQLGLGVSSIVIDPGHGGHDPGARVRGLTEADLVLDVALRLEGLLHAKSGIDVVLTRRTNAFVSLEERTAIANRADADLFLSIHVNASRNARASGVESYYLNFAPDAAAKVIAARENATSSMRMRDLPSLVRLLATTSKRDESRDLAAALQGALFGHLRGSNRTVKDLGVKQAPFMVLVGATMPSALIEIAFITNRDEAARLRTESYRQVLADGLYAGLLRYQQGVKKTEAVARR